MKRINEIVVVEGKTDSQLLKELYDVSVKSKFCQLLF